MMNQASRRTDVYFESFNEIFLCELVYCDLFIY